MDNEARLIMKTYIVHKVALKPREEKEQMYQEDRSPPNKAKLLQRLQSMLEHLPFKQV